MYNCRLLHEFVNRIRATELVKRVVQRTKIPISTHVVVPFDFDNPADVIAYQSAKLKCARQFSGAFVWRADVAEGMATFGFTRFTDAVLFAMAMPTATLRAA